MSHPRGILTLPDPKEAPMPTAKFATGEDVPVPDEPTTPEPADQPAPEPAPIDPEPTTAIAVPEPIRPDDLPLMPGHQEARDLASLAGTLAAADCLPSALRRKPNDVFMVLLTGRDLGLRPSVAIRSLHVIDGQVTVPPKVKLALVRERGLGRVWPDPDNGPESATWYAVRADQPDDLFASKVTIQEANQIRLSASKMLTDKDNWKNYPARMLSWRALGYVLDDAFSEVGTGLYSPDEIGAVTDEDGEPLMIGDVEVLPGMRGGRARPSAEDPTMAEAEIAAIQRRINRLPDGAKPVLRAKWMEKEVPHVSRLRRSDDVLVGALLAWVEKKATAGEWGEWSAEPPGGDEGPDMGSSTAESPAGPDPAKEEAGPADGGVEQPGEVHPPLSDPGMCLHPVLDEIDGRDFCVSCGEAI